MNARPEFQVIVDADGKPAFIVIPYAQFRKLRGNLAHGAVLEVEQLRW